MVPRDNIISDLTNLWSSQELTKDKIENLLGRLKIENNSVDAIKGSSLSAILTEWDEFKDCDWESLVKSMKSPSIVYDRRNILPKQDKKINYIKLGVTNNL